MGNAEDAPSSSSIYIAVGATIGGLVITTATVVGTCSFAFLVALMRRVSDSVGTAPPTSSMKQEEDLSKSALFRHLPKLRSTLAWRSLGALDESPIHICRLPSKSKTIKEQGRRPRPLEFLVKREDLISPLYGGNKVRTLQHQLAVCEAKREAGQKAYRHIVTLGSGGSNNVLATVVHARALGWDNQGDYACTITPCWLDKDEPDLDNTLNMLSVFSFPLKSYIDWGAKHGFLATL
ncbi:MAG: hypothetical protein SGARI_002310, partial [Bacillariaceae sp.]